MIGKISGRLDHCGADYALIEAAGVGYVIHCSERTLAGLPAAGSPVALYTELIVREDLLQLFGFTPLAEREWHRLLTSVQGVGAKGAMAILGKLGAEGIGRALTLGDTTAIRAAPGVGPKTAARLVMELRDKGPQIMALGARGAAPAMVSGVPETSAASPQTPPSAAMAFSPSPTDGAAAQADALSALVNLGYTPGEAAAAVAEAIADGPKTAQELIRAALRHLGPKG